MDLPSPTGRSEARAVASALDRVGGVVAWARVAAAWAVAARPLRLLPLPRQAQAIAPNSRTRNAKKNGSCLRVMGLSSLVKRSAAGRPAAGPLRLEGGPVGGQSGLTLAAAAADVLAGLVWTVL